MLRNALSCLIALAALSLPFLANAKKGPPDWLEKVKELTIPVVLLEERSDVVYLHDEAVIEVESDGTIVTTTRLAMLIRNSAGASEAVASVVYSEDTDKPLSIKAWMMPGKAIKGKVVEYKSKDIVDTVVEGPNGSAITTSRRRLIDGSGEAMVGWIFGYETVLKDEGVSPELFWGFQGDHPSVYSRLELRLPRSWSYRSHFFNEQIVEPTESDGAIVWESRTNHAFELQPMGSMNPAGIAIALRSPSGEREAAPDTWEALAAQLWPYYNLSEKVTSEMRQKVAELTSGHDELLEQVRALSEYAQSVNYVSISLDLGSGGGLRPRPPVEVFESNYGDCKDKTRLLTALLAEKGVEAYPLIVHWGGAGAEVAPEWVSPSQFNHCITAIKVPDRFESPNLVDHDSLGRLLIFDPTNVHATFGDLDDGLQGSKGMLLAGDSGGLIELPTLPLEARETRREVRAQVFLDGVSGHFEEISVGQQAANERSSAFTDSENYEKRISRWLAESIPSVKVSSIDQTDDREADRFSLDADFEAPGYGKNLRSRTLIFKPILIGRYEALPFGDEERTQPVHLSASCLVETYELALPEGFEVAEMPEDRSFAEDFGSYAIRFSHDADKGLLRVEREVRILAKEIALEQFPDLQRFYRARIKADQSAVVLEAI